jgi:hypothetical protein
MFDNKVSQVKSFLYGYEDDANKFIKEVDMKHDLRAIEFTTNRIVVVYYEKVGGSKQL